MTALSTTVDPRAHSYSTKLSRSGHRARTRRPRWSERDSGVSWTECRWTLPSRRHSLLRKTGQHLPRSINRDRILDIRKPITKASIRRRIHLRCSNRPWLNNKHTRTFLRHQQHNRSDLLLSTLSCSLHIIQVNMDAHRDLRRRLRIKRRSTWEATGALHHRLLTRQHSDKLNHLEGTELQLHRRHREAMCHLDSCHLRHLLGHHHLDLNRHFTMGINLTARTQTVLIHRVRILNQQLLSNSSKTIPGQG